MDADTARRPPRVVVAALSYLTVAVVFTTTLWSVYCAAELPYRLPADSTDVLARFELTLATVLALTWIIRSPMERYLVVARHGAGQREPTGRRAHRSRSWLAVLAAATTVELTLRGWDPLPIALVGLVTIVGPDLTLMTFAAHPVLRHPGRDRAGASDRHRTQPAATRADRTSGARR